MINAVVSENSIHLALDYGIHHHFCILLELSQLVAAYVVGHCHHVGEAAEDQAVEFSC